MKMWFFIVCTVRNTHSSVVHYIGKALFEIIFLKRKDSTSEVPRSFAAAIIVQWEKQMCNQFSQGVERISGVVP